MRCACIRVQYRSLTSEGKVRYSISEFFADIRKYKEDQCSWFKICGRIHNERELDAYLQGLEAGAGWARKLIEVKGGYKLFDSKQDKR